MGKVKAKKKKTNTRVRKPPLYLSRGTAGTFSYGLHLKKPKPCGTGWTTDAPATDEAFEALLDDDVRLKRGAKPTKVRIVKA